MAHRLQPEYGMSRLLRVVAMASVCTMVLPELAEAGVLSKVVHGLEQKANQGKRPGGGDAGSPRQAEPAQSEPRSDGVHRVRSPYSTRRHRPIFIGGYTYPTNTQGTEMRLYAAIQSVKDSGGAGVVSIRASHDDFGFELADTRYFESVIADGRQATLTLDVWNLAAAYRVAKMGGEERTAIWIKGGLAGTNTMDLFVLGAVAGAELAHNLSEAVGVTAEAKYFAMRHDISAVELRAGLALSILRISYRTLDFNTGPPLRGPEVGISLSF